MVDMVMQQILPAALRYASDLSTAILQKNNARISCKAETALNKELSYHTDSLYENSCKLSYDLSRIPHDSKDAADYFCDVIVPDMKSVREDADALEKITAKSYWPYPTYADLLFY